ncbi:MAG: alpha/beta hydrolase [Candidatus Hydrogenedentes bacterium]|nr:alpha/beta hydrolase [Candidatus Hydrogenedentota bacterium]
MDYEFAPLSIGETCFQYLKEGTGNPIVFVHGFSSPMCIWDRNFYFLNEHGFSVLRYDLYGRGRSGKPRVGYTLELFVTQLKELLDYLNIRGEVSLAGLSMGCSICASFTINFPERVKDLILIAPAGLGEKSFTMKLITLPIIGTFLYELVGKKMLVKGVLDTIGDDPEGRKYILREYEFQIADPMYRYALISTLKYGPLYGLDWLYRRLGLLENKRGALIWGTSDNVVHFSLHKEILNLVPWLSFFPIEGGTHVVNFQKSEIVNRVLLNSLQVK